jgi:hypothetical protein
LRPDRASDFERSDWRSCQIDLALEPGTVRKDRLNLLDNGGLDELIVVGRELAGFLDVPLHDHRPTFE